MKPFLTGKPPADHARRCQAQSRHTRKRCWKWALKGVRTCAFHGGRTAQKYQRNGGRSSLRYSKYLSKTLESKVEELTQGRHDSQLNLYDELALMRVMASDTIKLYDAALTKGKESTIANATALMQSALTEVRDMCLAASRVERDAEDKISARSISLFINQIVRCIQRVIPDDDALVMRLETDIRETVRLPEELAGTLLTPSQVVIEMDQSIPVSTNGESK